MELIIDNIFRNTHDLYFRDLPEEIVLNRITSVFNKYDPEMVIDSINIIKTAIVLGMTYSECHDKIVSTIIEIFPPGEDIDLFVLSLTMKILIAMKDENIESLLFKPRDIIKEVASKYFRVPLSGVSQDMINTINTASTNFAGQNYALDDPPIKNWDEYFFNICRQVARNSKCLSRRIGAVLVWDKGIISTGYNGPPRGVPKCDIRWKIDKNFFDKYGKFINDSKLNGVCPRHIIGFKSGEGLDVCIAGHAERNALINAARKGIATKDTTMYMSCGIPCSPCLVEIINAGVKEIVVTSLKTYDESSMYLLNQSSLGIRLYDFVK